MFKVTPSQSSTGSPLLLKLALQSGDRGFTMFEVLIALMISFLFLTGTLNSMVIATAMRVKAERQAQANYWIKEDLEQVRALAANFNPSTGNGCPSGVGDAFRTNSTAGVGLASLPVPGNKTILGRTASLTRTATGAGNVLTLTYRVDNTEIADTTQNRSSRILASLYTEVLPAAALTCP